jgi:hypothetical protein
MDQKWIVVFLHLKGLSAKAKNAHTEFVKVLRSDVIIYRLWQSRYGTMSFCKWDRGRGSSGRSRFLDYTQCNSGGTWNDAICFYSQIAKMTFVPPTTIFRRLMKSLHLVLKRLHSIPHRLSDLQKQTRAIMSTELLKLLESMRHYAWKCIVTLDEAWFYLSIFLLITN